MSSDLISLLRKRHNEVIKKAQRLKQDDTTTVQGKDGGTEHGEKDSSVTTDEIKVSQLNEDPSAPSEV